MKKSKAPQVRPTAPLHRDLDASEIASLQVPPAVEAMLKDRGIPKEARGFVAAAVRMFLNPGSSPADHWAPPKVKNLAEMKAAVREKVNADLKRLGFADRFQVDIFTLPGVKDPVASNTPRRARKVRK